MLVANVFEPGDNGVTVQPLIVFGFPSNLTRGGHRQNFTDRLIGWAQAIIAAFHLINGGPPP